MTLTRTAGGAAAYALLEQAFEDPSRAREIAGRIGAMYDQAAGAEQQEIADASRMCVKLIREDAGLAAELAHFNPDQPRGPDGKWVSGGLPWHTEGDTVHYHGSLDLPREEVPQLSGTINGTYHGPAEVIPRFEGWLARRGVTVTHTRADPAGLRPVKATGSFTTVRGLADEVKSGKRDPDWKPVFVSSDGYVLDGTQTWAAKMLADSEGGPKPGVAVARASVPLDQLMPLAARFMSEIGMPYRKAGEVADPRYRRGAGLAAELAAARGHHIPGTPYTYRHGWIPVGPGQPGFRDSLSDHTRGGKLDPARQALHDQIVAGHLAGHQREEHPVAVFLGGGTAAGKSTRWPRGTQPGVHIDPDEIKNEIPEYGPLKAARDRRASAHVHEESSLLSKRVMSEAARNGYSFTLDGTGDGTYEKMKNKIDSARKSGHLVVGKYMTIDTEEAIRRAGKRAEQTGRDVSPTVARELHAAVSDVFARLIENDDLDAAELWDNNGERPVLVGRKELGGTWQVADPRAWQRFLAKREEE
jgi:predicted ABC-type ATPase